MEKYNTEYKDYKNHIAIMISTDRGIFNERSAVRARMSEHAKGYKELHIIVFATRGYESQVITDNCYVYSTNSIFKLLYIFDAYILGKRIIKLINKEDQILITCQDPFETGLVGRFLHYFNRKSELLLQIHTDLFSPYFTKYFFLNKIRLFISNYTLPYANNIRVVSDKIADSLVDRGINKNKIIIKPININSDFFKTSSIKFDLRNKYKQFNKIILVVSRLEREKNIDGAIRAFAIAKEDLPNVGMVIVGSGREMGELKKLSYDLGISESVIFEGWQTDLVSYYKGADVLLVTSWYEGYGVVFKEAEASNCRIISTDVGIASEVNAIITTWDSGDIADKIVKLLK